MKEQPDNARISIPYSYYFLIFCIVLIGIARMLGITNSDAKLIQNNLKTITVTKKIITKAPTKSSHDVYNTPNQIVGLAEKINNQQVLTPSDALQLELDYNTLQLPFAKVFKPQKHVQIISQMPVNMFNFTIIGKQIKQATQDLTSMPTFQHYLIWKGDGSNIGDNIVNNKLTIYTDDQTLLEPTKLAIQKWQSLIGANKIQFVNDKKDASVVIVSAKTATSVTDHEATIATTNTNYVHGHNKITVYQDQFSKKSNAGREYVIAHEIGHALGAVHTNKPNELMYPEFKVQPIVVSQQTLNQLHFDN